MKYPMSLLALGILFATVGCSHKDKPTGPKDAISVAAIDMTTACHPVSPASVKITRTMTAAHIDKKKKEINGVVVDVSGWDATNSKVDKNICGRIFLFWQSGGVWYGAQADHWRPKDTKKTLQPNCYPGGNYWIRYPPAGATIYACIYDNVFHERTNIIKCSGAW